MVYPCNPQNTLVSIANGLSDIQVLNIDDELGPRNVRPFNIVTGIYLLLS